MSFDVSVSEEEMQESQQTPALREGYIGPVELINVEAVELGDAEHEVIRFTFECQDVDHKGQQFEHLEWPPDAEDFGDNSDTDANGATNADIQLRRLIHMLSRLLNTTKENIRKQIVVLRGETLQEAWNNLRKRVVQAYEKYGFDSDNDIRAKVYASTNSEGYVNVQFGKYPGFIRVVGEDPKLEFNQWERQQNQEARVALNSSPDSDDEFGGDDDFDYDVDVEDTDF